MQWIGMCKPERQIKPSNDERQRVCAKKWCGKELILLDSSLQSIWNPNCEEKKSTIEHILGTHNLESVNLNDSLD